MKRTKKSATPPPATCEGGKDTETTEAIKSGHESQAAGYGPGKLPGNLAILNVADVLPNPKNPRGTEKPDAEFLEFAANIKSQGVREPVLVRTHPAEEGKYEILNGHRRLAACLHNSMLEIPAITCGDISDREAFEIFFACQIQKKLKLFEEAKLVAILTDEYKGDVAVVAARIGKPVRWVRQMAAINSNLAPCWRKPFEKGELANFTAGHLRLLAGWPQVTQKGIFEYLGDTMDMGDMSVADLEEMLADQMRRLDKASFDVQDPTLAKAACTTCLMRTDVRPGLFDDTADEKAVEKNARCLSPQCWRQKETAALANRVTELKKEYPELVVMSKEYLTGEEREAAAKHRLPIISYDEFEASKKDAKGAVPAVVIKGAGLGELIWIKTSAGRKEVLGEDGQVRTRPAGTPKTLKERRALLESKRWFVTIKALIEKINIYRINDFDSHDKIRTVMALAGTFGVTGMVPDYSSGRVISSRTWKYFASQIDTDEVLAGLWEQCRATICRDLTCNCPITQVPERLIEDAKSAAKLLGIDIDALYEETGEKQYPQPKGWANLKADGTPKEKVKGKSEKVKSAAKAKIRKCRICGCTEENPCLVKGEPCHWVEKDLCSNPDCLKKANIKNPAGKKSNCRHNDD
jgi:ParB/RepB/Spo0J family partition protein